MFCFWCHVLWRVLSERRALDVRKATNTNCRHTGDFRLQQTGSSNSRQIAVIWEGKDARKERDKRNEKWRHIRRNNDIWFAESDLNVVGFVTLRGPKRTVLPMVGMWHCISLSRRFGRTYCLPLQALRGPGYTTEDDGMASVRMVGEHQTAKH